MSVDAMRRPAQIDDAQLRFQGLMDHVDNIQTGIKDFPGALNLNSLVSSYRRMAGDLYPRFVEALEVETDHRTRFEATHRMVDRLAKEWETVFQLTANAKLLGSYLNTTDNFSWLDAIVNTAQTDLNLSSWDFIVVPRVSLRYALTSFRYAPRFGALELPVGSLNTGWEWSVLWHELAGRIIRELGSANRTAFDVASVLNMDEAEEEDVSDLIKNLMEKLEMNEAVGSPLLNKIRRLLRSPRKPNWSRDWVEELFEDACSVLTFGEDFIPVLKNILERQQTSEDKRHPPREIRLRIARRLLGESVQVDTAEQDEIEQDVTRHIRALIENLGLPLPLIRGNENQVHSALRNLMKKFAQGTVSLVDTREFKNQINDFRLKLPEYEKKGARDLSVEISTWEEVASGNWKKMLNMPISESDLALSTHTSGEFGWMAITVHNTIHNFYHWIGNHK